LLSILKNAARSVLLTIGWDLTTNLRYDRLTRKIIMQLVRPGMACVDVGCHKGEILDLLLAANPLGPHWGFEPIPDFRKELETKYQGRASIMPQALSTETGETEFHYVKNAPAYSGIKRRTYATSQPDISLISVPTARLDELLVNEKIGFVKIDVEGAELQVLLGAESLIARCRPYVLFEFGLGASDHYGTRPEDLFDYFDRKEMGIWTLQAFVVKEPPMSLSSFTDCYLSNSEYYFLAGPK
jgi:FkbM family methyltransferase